MTTRFGILHYDGPCLGGVRPKERSPAEYFTRVARDPTGTLWFATFDGGVVSYARGKWTAYGRENGLPAELIADLAVDARKSLDRDAERRGRASRPGHLGEGWICRGAETNAPDTTLAGDSLRQFDPQSVSCPEARSFSERWGERSEYCLGFDKTGHCLVGTSTGVYRLVADGWQTLEFPRSMRGLQADRRARHRERRYMARHGGKRRSHPPKR